MPYKTLKNKIDMWKIVTFTLNEKKNNYCTLRTD